MDAGRHRLPARATRPTTWAVLAALALLLGLLLAAPTRAEASVPPPATAMVVASPHHGASGALGCHAVAACVAGVMPAADALHRAYATGQALGLPHAGLTPPSRVLVPDLPPPRP